MDANTAGVNVNAGFNIARLRAREIANLVKYRHGRLPNTDDKVIYIDAVRSHLQPRDGDLAFALENWCRQVGAVLHWNDIKAAVAKAPHRTRADTLGRALRLLDAERAACKIVTIGAIDVDKAERAERRKAKHRERARQRRIAAGATPRDQSLSRTQPWKSLGISRSTWERRRKAGAAMMGPLTTMTNLTTTTSLIVSTTLPAPRVVCRPLRPHHNDADASSCAVRKEEECARICVTTLDRASHGNSLMHVSS